MTAEFLSGRRGDKSQVRTLHRAFCSRTDRWIIDVVDLWPSNADQAEEVVVTFVSNAEPNRQALGTNASTTISAVR